MYYQVTKLFTTFKVKENSFFQFEICTFCLGIFYLNKCDAVTASEEGFSKYFCSIVEFCSILFILILMMNYVLTEMTINVLLQNGQSLFDLEELQHFFLLKESREELLKLNKDQL